MRILGNRILVMQDKAEEVSPGGIILTDYSKKKNNTALVVEVGEDVKDIRVFDRVIVKDFNGEKWVVEGKELVFLKEEDILAKIIEE